MLVAGADEDRHGRRRRRFGRRGGRGGGCRRRRRAHRRRRAGPVEGAAADRCRERDDDRPQGHDGRGAPGHRPSVRTRRRRRSSLWRRSWRPPPTVPRRGREGCLRIGSTGAARRLRRAGGDPAGLPRAGRSRRAAARRVRRRTTARRSDRKLEGDGAHRRGVAGRRRRGRRQRPAGAGRAVRPLGDPRHRHRGGRDRGVVPRAPGGRADPAVGIERAVPGLRGLVAADADAAGRFRRRRPVPRQRGGDDARRGLRRRLRPRRRPPGARDRRRLRSRRPPGRLRHRHAGGLALDRRDPPSGPGGVDRPARAHGVPTRPR